MSVKLSITNQSRGRVDVAWLLRQLRRVLELLDLGRGEWTLTLVGDREMAALHQRTMNLPGTTDVLSFDLGTAGDLELDTVICRDEAARRAQELGHGLREEVLLYALHSLLHVRGYDDVTATGARRMHRREDEILLGLGVGALYAGKGTSGRSGRRAHGRKRLTSGRRKKAS